MGKNKRRERRKSEIASVKSIVARKKKRRKSTYASL